MNRRKYFPLVAFALSLLAAVAFVVGRSAGTRAAGANSALAALPASDFVIAIDAQRALSETLPTLLAANPTALAKFNAELDEFQRKTGINPRTLESIAVGGNFTPGRPHNSMRAVVIARGSFRSDELLEGAFTAAKAKDPNFQKAEQQYEGRTIFLVGTVRNVKGEIDAGKTLGQVLAESKGEKMAVTALDSNTIAAGELDGVRAAIDASLGRGGRVDDELVRLASETPGAVVSFSGRVPQNAGVKVGDSAIEKYFASVRQFYGSFNADGAEAQALLTLRTETVEQANDMGQALNSLKSLAAFGFSRSGGSAKDASVGDLLRSLSVTTLNNEVQISVKIPQASFAPLVKTF
ncbi:MAG TPA: hypothetical protein VGC87_24645 [Pyrinomonadaceae bacterium]|jgi:hypothetical protein